ncbi:MAG: DUF2341 domain-containing protein [Deltaproteobacteria bacterium]|nr:DUF2341 domain-containing protein [Deltaproteobacteria bacterium]
MVALTLLCACRVNYDLVGTADGSTADGSMPDGSMPDGSMPDGSMPDGSMPDGSMPDGSMVDGSTPDGSMADGSTADWWHTDWQSRTRITFNNTNSAEDLINFPVLVSLAAADVDFSHIEAGGADVRFVDGDGTLLNHEIESWDDTPGSESANIWVRAPQVDGSSSTDFIWMYYNNPTASDAQNPAGVWDANYAGVWHLEEQGGATHDDSTGAHDGTRGDNVYYAGEGRDAQTFDGASDYVSIADHPDLSFGNGGSDSAFSVSAWIKGETNAGAIIAKEDAAAEWDLFLHSDGRLGLELYDAEADYIGQETTVTASGAWQHVVATYDGRGTSAGIELYIDGDAQTLNLDEFGPYGGMPDSNADVSIGVYARGGNVYDFDGQIDEARISSGVRSADWIEACFLSQNGTFGFNTFGSEELRP